MTPKKKPRIYHTTIDGQSHVCRANSFKEATKLIGVSKYLITAYGGGMYPRNDGTFEGQPIPDGPGPFLFGRVG